MKDFKTLTEAEYRAYPAESYSSIKYLLDSPQTFLYYKSKPFQGSDSTLLGTAVHNYFQGNKHLITYSIVDKRKKAEYEEFEKNFRSLAGEDGIIVPKSFEEKINAVMSNLNKNTNATNLLDGCKFEEPFLFEIGGISLKGKVDGIKKDRIVEIKTSSMATDAHEFRREAYNRDYDLQAYLYCQAAKVSKHYFIVANTTAPYKVSVYKSSQSLLDSGKEKAAIVVDRYKRYILGNEVYVDEKIEEI